ncbi:MAG: hypothetical protein U9P12_07445 [Verrucomicrobiota bacterium]|nr:hypothetical protein [Verrucomicrobiota bacterium]
MARGSPETQGELYDLQKDPKQQNNPWNRPEAADRQKQMMEQLMGQMALNVDPLPIRTGFC